METNKANTMGRILTDSNMQKKNMWFKGPAGVKGHILSVSCEQRSSLTPLKRGRTSQWGVLRVKPRPCVATTVLPISMNVCLCEYVGVGGGGPHMGPHSDALTWFCTSWNVSCLLLKDVILFGRTSSTSI